MSAIGFIILVLGLLFEFIDIWQFLNNVWELVIMFIVFVMIELKSAGIGQEFKGMKNVFICLYNQKLYPNMNRLSSLYIILKRRKLE